MSDHLLDYIKNNDVIQHGEVSLSSGKMSDFYCDIKKVVLDSEGLARFVPALLHALLKTAKFDAIGGLELGVVPLIGALLMYADVDDIGGHLRGFIVRKKPKEHGTRKFIEGPVKPGMKVAIVEDVTTTGGSAHLAYLRAKDFGLQPVVVGAIFNRKEGADSLFESIGLPFVYLLDKTKLTE